MSKGIVLKSLEFDNMFSYGKGNVINLLENDIVQLSAPNGYGKTSLSIILQELLFNKNVKKLTKKEIKNRYVEDNYWKGKLDFDVDDNEYTLTVNRVGEKSTVKLIENGEDISEHKVLDTYKKINEIFGLDFEIFSQLTYQSSTDYLEFLKATDANRKKFLINLFNLNKYLDIGQSVKTKLAAKEKERTNLEGQLKTVEDYLSENSDIPQKMDLIVVPAVDETLAIDIAALNKESTDYNSTCSKIDKNNLLIVEQSNLVFDMSMKQPVHTDKEDITEERQGAQELVAINKKAVKSAEDQLKKLDLSDTCFTCGQPIDNTKTLSMQAELEEEVEKLNAEIDRDQEIITNIGKVLIGYKREEDAYAANQKAIERYEQLNQLIDDELPEDYPDFHEITDKLTALNKTLREQKAAREEAEAHNESVKIRNTKIDTIVEQVRNFKARKELLLIDIGELDVSVSNLDILKKAFSTTGIVAFKLENVAKDLEDSINTYLATLSDGEFQVIFRLEGEKLNVIVISNGKEVTINSLSQGELNRVQTSVLLAVRNTLSKIGGKNINLLFLDEIMGVLDATGKEKLIEILQEEEDLNVFLISHEFEHPLIEKIEVIKENNISHLE